MVTKRYISGLIPTTQILLEMIFPESSSMVLQRQGS